MNTCARCQGWLAVRWDAEYGMSEVYCVNCGGMPGLPSYEEARRLGEDHELRRKLQG